MRRPLATLLMLAVLIVVIWTSAWIVTSAMVEDALAREWPMGLGSIRDVYARHLRVTEPTGAALELERQTGHYGLPMSGRARRRVPEALRVSASAYLDAELAHPDLPVAPLPPPLADFLVHHQTRLAETRALLVSGAPIRWPDDLRRGYEMPTPDLAGHLLLERVYLASALATGSWEDLRAAAALVRPLSGRSDTISNILALQMQRYVYAAARKMPAPAPPWFAEVLAFDARRPMLASFQAEAAMFADLERNRAFGMAGRRGGRALSVIGRPFLNLAVASHVDHVRRSAQELAQTRSCAFDGGAFNTRVTSGIARWNVPSKIAMLTMGTMWSRVIRSEVERDAARITLALKSGATPALTPPCLHGQWVREPERIRFSRPMLESHFGTDLVPLEIVTSAPPAVSNR